LGLGLLNLFAQHFKLQPLVFSFPQILLRFCKRIRGLIEFLAILLEQVGVVKPPLLFGDFRLQFGDRFGQDLQRVLFIEIKPALRGDRARARLCFPGRLDRCASMSL
jgi:hypothetical protein